MVKTVAACFTIMVLAFMATVLLVVDDLDKRLGTMLDAFGMFLWAVGTIVVLAMLLVTAVILYYIWQKYRTKLLRPVDGAFPLQSYRLRRWRLDLPWWMAVLEWLRGERLIVNINTMVSSAAVISPRGYEEIAPSAGWALQAQIRQAVEVTNRVRAAFQGDESRSTQYGAQSARIATGGGGLLRSLMSKSDKPEPAQLSAPVEDIDVPAQVVSVEFVQALRGNSPTEFALGQTTNGDVVRWDVETTPHVRIHGKTQGSGKTNLIKTIALGAIAQGGHVIVLDRRGFKDWHPYRSHVELIDNRQPGVFGGTIRQLVELYRQRDEMLGRHGVGNISDLPNSPQRVFVVISEFGTACNVAKQRDELDGIIADLKALISEAAATGVHLIMEDQTNSGWPRAIRGNAEPITGYIPEDTAAAGGYKKAHELKAYEFHLDGQRFTTWNMQAEAPRLLPSLRPDNALLIDTAAFVVGSPANDCELTTNGQKAALPVVANATNGTNATNGDEKMALGSLKIIFSSVRSWDAVAQKFFADNPEATQADLRALMAKITDDGRDPNAFKGEAHRLYHIHSPNGNNYQPSGQAAPAESLTAAEKLASLGYGLSGVRLASGEPLGTDITYGGN